MGIVVGFETKSNPSGGHRLLFTLDDGSAVVNCIVWRDSSAARDRDLQELPLGSLLRAKGRMKTYRGQRQLTAWHIAAERDPLAEPLRWLELERLWRDVYSTDPRPVTAAMVDASGSKRTEMSGGSAADAAWRMSTAAAAGSAQQPEVQAVRRAIERLVGLSVGLLTPAPLLPEAGPAVQPAAPLTDGEADGEGTMPNAGGGETIEAAGAGSPAAAAALPTKRGSFAYSSLLLECSPVFQEAVRCASAAAANGAGNSTYTLAAAKVLVLRAVQGLKADGLLELVDADADVYAPFDAEAQLLPAIIRHVSRASAGRDGSITLVQLRAELQQHERHAFTVSDATLRTAIEVLLERSLLYETGRDSFRILA